jgi:hypothetical protein
MVTVEKLLTSAHEDFTVAKFVEEAQIEAPQAPCVYLLERKARVEQSLAQHDDESKNTQILRIIHRATVGAIAQLCTAEH